MAHQIISTYSFLGMCGWCCPICQVADSAQKLGESYLLYFVLGCFVPCVPVFLVRDKAREKYGLEGSTGKNYHISYLCAKHDLLPILSCRTRNSATQNPSATRNRAQLAFLMVATRKRNRNFIKF